MILAFLSVAILAFECQGCSTREYQGDRQRQSPECHNKDQADNIGAVRARVLEEISIIKKMTLDVPMAMPVASRAVA